MTEHDPIKEHKREAIRKKQEEAQFCLEEAAPDLLAALRGMLSMHEDFMARANLPVVNEAPIAARAAIAKAEGSQATADDQQGGE